MTNEPTTPDPDDAAQQLHDELTEIGSAFAGTDDDLIDELREAMTDESLGAMLITQERRRAVHELGYGRHHDDEHHRGELLDAALAYIAHAADLPLSSLSARARWPWSPESFRPGSPTRDLVKAGQFLAAEIDRRFRDQHLTEPVRPERTVQVRFILDEYDQLHAMRAEPGATTDRDGVVVQIPEGLWRDHERTWHRWTDTLEALVRFTAESGTDVREALES